MLLSIALLCALVVLPQAMSYDGSVDNSRLTYMLDLTMRDKSYVIVNLTVSITESSKSSYNAIITAKLVEYNGSEESIGRILSLSGIKINITRIIREKTVEYSHVFTFSNLWPIVNPQPIIADAGVNYFEVALNLDKSVGILVYPSIYNPSGFIAFNTSTGLVYYLYNSTSNYTLKIRLLEAWVAGRKIPGLARREVTILHEAYKSMQDLPCGLPPCGPSASHTNTLQENNTAVSQLNITLDINYARGNHSEKTTNTHTAVGEDVAVLNTSVLTEIITYTHQESEQTPGTPSQSASKEEYPTTTSTTSPSPRQTEAWLTTSLLVLVISVPVLLLWRKHR